MHQVRLNDVNWRLFDIAARQLRMLGLKRDVFSLSLISARTCLRLSYYKSTIAYINDGFIDKPTATFPALFCYVRMRNT